MKINMPISPDRKNKFGAYVAYALGTTLGVLAHAVGALVLIAVAYNVAAEPCVYGAKSKEKFDCNYNHDWMMDFDETEFLLITKGAPDYVGRLLINTEHPSNDGTDRQSIRRQA